MGASSSLKTHICSKHKVLKVRRTDSNGWRCPQCRKESSAKRYKIKGAEQRVQQQAYYEENRDAILERTRWWAIKKKYNITKEEYEALFAKQRGRCAICRVRATDAPKGFLCVDHNHKTGKVRGLLCWNCNVAIGHLRDNAKLLRKAIDYLARK